MDKMISLFLVSWESNWTPLWADDWSQIIFPAGGSPRRAARSHHLVGSAPLTATRLCSQARGPVLLHRHTLGKPSWNNLQQLTLGTRRHLYFPPEQVWYNGIWQIVPASDACLWYSVLQNTLCCYSTFYSTFWKCFRSVSNLRFNPSKTGSTTRSPWDWEVK